MSAPISESSLRTRGAPHIGQKSASGATSRSQRSQRGSGFIVLGGSTRPRKYSSLALLQQQADPFQPFVLAEQAFFRQELHQGAQTQLDGRLVADLVEGLRGDLGQRGGEARRRGLGLGARDDLGHDAAVGARDGL